MKKSKSKPPIPQASNSKIPQAAVKSPAQQRQDDYDAAYYRRKRMQMVVAAVVATILAFSMVITIISPFLMAP